VTPDSSGPSKNDSSCRVSLDRVYGRSRSFGKYPFGWSSTAASSFGKVGSALSTILSLEECESWVLISFSVVGIFFYYRGVRTPGSVSAGSQNQTGTGTLRRVIGPLLADVELNVGFACNCRMQSSPYIFLHRPLYLALQRARWVLLPV
jgi:hypothetical protein